MGDMFGFAVAFSLGAGYTVALIGIVLAFVKKEPEVATPSNLFATKDEFDMLCRIVHDMSRERDGT